LIFVWAKEQPETSSLYRQGAKLQFLDDNLSDVLVPWTDSHGRVFQRYYHLFEEGELEGLLGQPLIVRERGYDRDNWWLIFEKNK